MVYYRQHYLARNYTHKRRRKTTPDEA